MAIDNDTDFINRNPLLGLFMGQSGAIEASERSGQVQLVNSAQLPKKGVKELASAGVVVIGPSAGDDLFVDVTLPEGWNKERTDHSMWSNLMDEKGRKRGSIFYKAAFYDRDAFMSAIRRFQATYEPVGGWAASRNEDPNKRAYAAIAKDGDTEIWRSEGHTAETLNVNAYDTSSAVCKLAAAWLNEHYPGWEDVNAYWD